MNTRLENVLYVIHHALLVKLIRINVQNVIINK